MFFLSFGPIDGGTLCLLLLYEHLQIYKFTCLFQVKVRKTTTPSQSDEEAHQLAYMQKHLHDLLSLLAAPLENTCSDSQVNGWYAYIGFYRFTFIFHRRHFIMPFWKIVVLCAWFVLDSTISVILMEAFMLFALHFLLVILNHSDNLVFFPIYNNEYLFFYSTMLIFLGSPFQQSFPFYCLWNDGST